MTNSLDDEFKAIGESGVYQFCMVMLVSITVVTQSIFDYRFVFIDATPDFRWVSVDAHFLYFMRPNVRSRCKIFENETFAIASAGHQQLIDKYLIRLEDGVYDGCKIRRFNANLSHNFTLGKCDAWVFSTQYYRKTIVTDVSRNENC